MKSLRNSIFYSIAVLVIFSCSKNESYDSIDSLTAQKFEEIVNTNKEAIILDVRTPDEYSEGHISGALNIDYMDDAFEQEIANLNKSKTYLVYCKAGVRQDKASIRMKELGFEHIILLEGGITSWQQNGMPLEN
ncbi:rhodanese-like domain-containing protein [Algoriphagus sp.]|uniref:rhodanese-like domain-containing protein n=1 Tax=Algoriphagus sp. TaxID=1872435 RepID=UPI0025D53B59|nr:rhodanese-like domain-containing protein [Algoriphagus sp.]